MAICGCGAPAVPPAEVAPLQPAAQSTVNASASPAALPTTPRSTSRPDDWFADLTDQSGVHFMNRNGREAGRFYMIESFGGGVGAIDFDLDDDIDLFLTGGGTISPDESSEIAGLPSAMFRNDGQCQFRDATQASGLDSPVDYSQGCAVTDFNVDGLPDLCVCCYGRNRLYRNQGDGTFTEELQWLSSPPYEWSTAATFGDIDRDGLPDLFVARYADWSPERDVKCSGKGIRDLCGPSSYAGTTCRVFHNLGNGTFEDWSTQVGVGGNVHGLAVVAADLNLDGYLDFYVASDVTPNQLYLGGHKLPLVDRGPTAGVAFNEWGQAEGSMGVDVADYDGDGRPDIFVTNFELEDNALYQNQGDGLFLHATVASGLAGVSRMRVGFGTSLADFDGDGRPDLFVLNGNPIYAAAETPFLQQSQLFRNLGNRFEDVSERGGTFFRECYSGRGNAAVDLDNDGSLDLVVVPLNDPVRILRNQNPAKNFIRVHLRGLRGEPDATGATVSMNFAGRKIVQFVTRGTGFFSQPDPRMIFPVESSQTAVDVTVHWPGRSLEIYRGLAARKSHVLLEGRGDVGPK